MHFIKRKSTLDIITWLLLDIQTVQAEEIYDLVLKWLKGKPLHCNTSIDWPLGQAKKSLESSNSWKGS